MRHALPLVLVLGLFTGCAQEEPVKTHNYERADGSGLASFEELNYIRIPFWQPGLPFCEDATTVGGYVEHGRCASQESAATAELVNGEPVWRYGSLPRISDKHLKRLLRWRNRFDRPFSMFVVGPDHSREAKYKYSIRLAYGHILDPSPIIKAWKNSFENKDDTARGYGLESQTKSWAVRNLSEYAARDWSYFVAELFAWYTAPWYEKGSLPSEVEEQLEKMASFDWKAEWEYDRPDVRGDTPALADHPALLQMKTALARARRAEPCNCYVDNPFMAHDELTFLYIWRWEYHFNASWPTYDKYAVPLCKYPTSHPSYESSCNKRD